MNRAWIRSITRICMIVWSCRKKFGYNFARLKYWGGARVVEWDSLENYCGLRSTGGSNPPLPAEDSRRYVESLLFFQSSRGSHEKDAEPACFTFCFWRRLPDVRMWGERGHIHNGGS